MNIIKLLITYIETIVNIFSNALVQTFLVYTTVVLIYKFFIEEQTTNYIPTFVTIILDKLKNTYSEIDYGKNQYGQLNKVELEQKYKEAEFEESKIYKENKEHNRQVINNALKMSVGIFSFFVLFTLITSHMSVHIHWYQLLLSAAITVVGTSYEYFFITQIIVKYNFIELTELFDAMAEKLDTISDQVVKGKLVTDLENIVQNNNNNNNNNDNGISSMMPSTGTLKNAINSIKNSDIKLNNVMNMIPNSNDIPHVNNNNNNNNDNNDIMSRLSKIEVNDIINKIGNGFNDIEHTGLKTNMGSVN